MANQDPDKTNETFLKTHVTKVGRSLYMLLSSDEVQNALDVGEGSDLRMQIEEGPHGTYLSVWNPEQQGEH